MSSGRFTFGPFALDPAERLLSREGRPVELGGRYLDALLLLVAEAGRLVSKDRFHQEVWRGIPVTDEALTQCIRMLRRQLGDDAASPRFIETVPKHGYRFVAPVKWVEDEAPAPALRQRDGQAAAALGESPFEHLRPLEPALISSAPPAQPQSAPLATVAVTSPHMPPHAYPARPTPLVQALQLAAAGTLGGGAAGMFGGVVYGLLGASQPLAPGIGVASVLLVLVAITTAIGLVGAAGVSLGIAAGGLVRGGAGLWTVLGAAAGGLLVGGAVKLLGLDALTLLLGQAPGAITGAGEGMLLGAGIGLGHWLALRRPDAPFARALALAALAGAAAGTLVSLAGGRLMAGSLDLLVSGLPQSRLRLDRLGALLGEDGFGPLSRTVTAALEAALFSAGTVGALLLAGTRLVLEPEAA